jgi:hypothetical protein
VRGGGSASRGAATPPAAPGAGRVAGDGQSGWTAGDPFPLKRYLAEP